MTIPLLQKMVCTEKSYTAAAKLDAEDLCYACMLILVKVTRLPGNTKKTRDADLVMILSSRKGNWAINLCRAKDRNTPAEELVVTLRSVAEFRSAHRSN